MSAARARTDGSTGATGALWLRAGLCYSERMNRRCLSTAAAVLVLFVAPAGAADLPAQPQNQTRYQCPHQRDSACTREHAPVCARRATGVVCFRAPCPQAAETRTYANGCTACADPAVFGYINGTCEGEREPPGGQDAPAPG